MTTIEKNHSPRAMEVKGNFFETCGHNNGAFGVRTSMHGKGLIGTAFMYEVGVGHHFSIKCNYELEMLFEACPLCRQNVGRETSKPSLFESDGTPDKIIVLFGSEMNANRAAALLENLMEEIKERGLFTGKDGADEHITVENPSDDVAS